MAKLDYFNRLPAREEYLLAIRVLMSGGGEFQLKSLVAKSGMSRTQVLCALQALIDTDCVVCKKVGRVKFFYLN
jgi:hypothetical protein